MIDRNVTNPDKTVIILTSPEYKSIRNLPGSSFLEYAIAIVLETKLQEGRKQRKLYVSSRMARFDEDTSFLNSKITEHFNTWQETTAFASETSKLCSF